MRNLQLAFCSIYGGFFLCWLYNSVKTGTDGFRKDTMALFGLLYFLWWSCYHPGCQLQSSNCRQLTDVSSIGGDDAGPLGTPQEEGKEDPPPLARRRRRRTSVELVTSNGRRVVIGPTAESGDGSGDDMDTPR
ncbi:hypothetical protein QR680_000424 [Steinernema hermaphroditum]|uniref:Uncharacterized protein n=1 Tax=Steinernema hermaphroditum TaxID=289476 RepID=A0AA39GVF0_9BILA|nr:hypothetical protein QR680_000424 [Steinernema hermaphroditum]